jgi:hypothetical protein
MSLTPEQINALRPVVAAEPSLSQAILTGNDAAIRDWLNSSVSSYFVWRPVTPADVVYDAIIWDRLTATDTPDGTTIQTNRELRCQAKQINLQILLQGRDYIATGRPNVRGGLSDALANVPSGANGATQDAGWLGAGRVKAVITRNATQAEKALTAGAGTVGNPATLVFEGEVTIDEAGLLR